MLSKLHSRTGVIVFMTFMLFLFSSRVQAHDCECDDEPSTSDDVNKEVVGVISSRVEAERADAFNPYVITAHKHNFILPVSYTSGMNKTVYKNEGIPIDGLFMPTEVKFQISLKSQLNKEKLLAENDGLFLGFTLEAWWQLYANKISSPFRETNYQPEIFYARPGVWAPFGGKSAFTVGLEHQSNGQAQGFSRSWNRVYFSVAYERENFFAFIRPWYRLPEKAKEFEGDAEGDDNPDILDYMGHGEIGLGWKSRSHELMIRTRGSLNTGKGAVMINYTFPMYGKFRGLFQYFNGYGDSLIDYNYFQQRLGLGVALTNMF